MVYEIVSKHKKQNGGPCRTWTYDQSVMSRVLWPAELKVHFVISIFCYKHRESQKIVILPKIYHKFHKSLPFQTNSNKDFVLLIRLIQTYKDYRLCQRVCNNVLKGFGLFPKLNRNASIFSKIPKSTIKVIKLLPP